MTYILKNPKQVFAQALHQRWEFCRLLQNHPIHRRGRHVHRTRRIHRAHEC